MPTDADEAPATPLYAFEQIRGRAESRRDPQEARSQLRVLWKRLGGDPADLEALEAGDPDGWQFLLRYVTDGPLGIQWYDAKRPELEAKQRRYNALLVGLAVVIAGLAFALPFQPLVMVLLAPELELAEATSRTGLVDAAALFGVMGTGGAVALRMSAQVVRYRRQAAVFHKASAALKEQLYRLESDWFQPPLVVTDAKGTRLHPAFATAIREAVGGAQAIGADERDAYFETLTIDVHALTDNAVAAQEALSEKAVFRGDRHHQHAKERRELAVELSKARLAVRTARAKIEVLEAEREKASPDEVGEIAVLLREQRMALQEAEQQQAHLEAVLEASRLG
ncbi:MAG: hypothetical protein KDK70_18875 [Myxococcales bacterium]|nr:hypothetical protein [Myxococcales bacterium]